MTPFLQRYGQGSGQPGRDWFHPLGGWFLVEMMRLEEVRPGILAFATRGPIHDRPRATALSQFDDPREWHATMSLGDVRWKHTQDIQQTTAIIAVHRSQGTILAP